ncbi:MAG: hypothetical protein Q4B40_00465 [Clostridia bacterium]|nr:hypothetical protein [Clostridia bacterium]
MAENLRVDLIYHRMASDFEMEFNLGGCCRMRLLNDKTTDAKGFIKALARGVERSRVIIGCGPLFGTDSIIKLVGAAIGCGTTVCDNKTYGINGDDEIKIIKGSTPLVTPDGYFGGCIIESGPQTMILLTENKAFRKSIMQTLIHPYMEEISYIPTKKIFADVPTVQEPTVSEPLPEVALADEGYLTEPDENYELELSEDMFDTPAPSTQEHNIDFVMDSPEEPQAEIQPEHELMLDDIYKMYTEVETPEEIEERYKNPYTPSESDNMYLADPDYDDYDDEYEKNSRSFGITIIVLIVLILLMSLAIIYLLFIKPMSMGISTGDYLKQMFGMVSAVRYLL